MQEAWNILPEGEEAWRIRFTCSPEVGDPYYSDGDVFLHRDGFSDLGLYLCPGDWSEWDTIGEIREELERIYESSGLPYPDADLRGYGWIIERYANDGTGAWEGVESSDQS